MDLLFKREIASNMSSCEIETITSISSTEQSKAGLILPREEKLVQANQDLMWTISETSNWTKIELIFFKAQTLAELSGKQWQGNLFKLRFYKRKKKGHKICAYVAAMLKKYQCNNTHRLSMVSGDILNSIKLMFKKTFSHFSH